MQPWQEIPQLRKNQRTIIWTKSTGNSVIIIVTSFTVITIINSDIKHLSYLLKLQLV